MGTVAVIPDWVTPAAGDIKGCHLRAHELAPNHLAARPIAATLDWVTGDHHTPITARPLEPTEAAARSEMMLATAVLTGQLGLPDDMWTMLAIPPGVAVTADETWLGQASATLGWLLGVHTRPPLRPSRPL